MAVAARKEIGKIASETGTPIIDDRTLADLVLEGSPPPPLAVHAPNGPILTVGSLSKLIGPSLRIGWVRAPESFIQRLARLKTAMDLGSPLIAQAADDDKLHVLPYRNWHLGKPGDGTFEILPIVVAPGMDNETFSQAVSGTK